MAREKEELNKPTNTVIGKNLTINAATITGEDSIRVDGTINGNISLDGTLFVSDTGHIEGDLLISSARIAGNIKGNITCRSTLHMAATAVVKGDITTAALIVDDGAVLYGLCKTRMSEESIAGTEVV
jgi:cytoskeletal protein CcmA (bactofilin family)